MDTSIVPAHLAVKAMRDNGYKNAAYAIAELMDNSIQHEATVVELLCAEREVQMNMRTVSRIDKIAVLDNGTGMTPDILQMALQFGNGTHLTVADQKGIGKFGMGLPSSSISQAKKVEVWTWQDGLENAFYSYLSLDEIINQKMKEIPTPSKMPVPDMWLKVGESFSRTGTLVVWSEIDRCVWKTASAIIDNSELLIGRMYRKFVYNEKVKIRMASFKETNTNSILEKLVRPNDPSYLMDKTSCPAPFDNSPMFNMWGGEEAFTAIYSIPYNGLNHDVKVRFSIAKEEARKGFNPGSKPYGKHAGKNLGVSVVRAERELDLDKSWTIPYDSRERWWGVEVDFPPALDEVFGVTNNKQFAVNFNDLAKIDVDEILRGKTIQQLKEELKEENDPKVYLIDIVQKIESDIRTMRSQIKAQSSSLEKDGKKRYDGQSTSPEQKATEATEDRVKDGFKGTSDVQEEKGSEIDRREEVENALINEGVTNPQEIVENLFGTSGLKYQFVDADIEGGAFFTVKSRGGKVIISLNINHPAYDKLIEVLERETNDQSQEELSNRLKNAGEGLKLLLMAWARYEDEQPDGIKKSITQDARVDWGRVARDFLKEE